ncbi:MAG: hypothetical protein JW795_19415 [Chitinivibrionales bacterium]|nr:hypothetical protein [Chitinivibrionales bacterium]
MNFEQNRQNLLNKLSKVRREKIIDRKVNSSKLKSLQKEKNAIEYSAPSHKEKMAVSLFGANSFFFRSLMQIMRASYNVFQSDNVDEICELSINQEVDHVLLDMDEPSKYTLATDVFNALKTINPKISLYLLTGDENSNHTQSLAAQGGIVITKPISFEDLYGYLNAPKQKD